MVLNTETMETNITKLTQMLNTYRNENQKVSIHFHMEDGAIRNCVVLEEIEINNQLVYLTGDNFMVNLNKKIKKIEFSDYEESVCIIFDQGEIYLDFVNS